MIPLVRRCLFRRRRREHSRAVDKDIETPESGGDIAKHLLHSQSVGEFGLEKSTVGSSFLKHLERLPCLTLTGAIVNSNPRAPSAQLDGYRAPNALCRTGD